MVDGRERDREVFENQKRSRGTKVQLDRRNKV